jgi:hypothetical protein
MKRYGSARRVDWKTTRVRWYGRAVRVPAITTFIVFVIRVLYL